MIENEKIKHQEWKLYFNKKQTNSYADRAEQLKNQTSS